MKTLEQLQEELQKANELCDYWERRRHNQVGNSPSDSEHHLDARRNLQKIEYQILQLKKSLTNT